METISVQESSQMVTAMILVIQENRQYLSEIDGAIGDGDHGINMSKGFTLCQMQLEQSPRDLRDSLTLLSRILIEEIGGSMGPLYGMFFKSMAKSMGDAEFLDAALFGQMLQSGEESVKLIGHARVGDKTMLDCLVPATQAYLASLSQGGNFLDALAAMKAAAIVGRDSTRDMVAKVGRASRLGERSRGVLDAGATSCCLLLEAMADCLGELLQR